MDAGSCRRATAGVNVIFALPDKLPVLYRCDCQRKGASGLRQVTIAAINNRPNSRRGRPES